MDTSKPESHVQLKEKVLQVLKAGAAGSVVLASTALSVPSAEAAMTRAESRPSIAERAAGVRRLAAEKLESSLPGDPQTLLAWGNWGNWHNGWHNGWHNWHNWHNWW